MQGKEGEKQIKTEGTLIAWCNHQGFAEEGGGKGRRILQSTKKEKNTRKSLRGAPTTGKVFKAL